MSTLLGLALGGSSPDTTNSMDCDIPLPIPLSLVLSVFKHSDGIIMTNNILYVQDYIVLLGSNHTLPQI